MIKKSTLLLLIITAIAYSINCKKKGGTTDPCAGVTVNVAATKVDASAGQSNGSITVTSPTGSGVTYSLNGATAVANAVYANLAPGSYTITAKTSAGCTGSASFTIAASDPCAGKTITVSAPTIVGSTPCVTTADGSLTVSATGSTGFTFKLGAGAFQSGTNFGALAAGNYVVTARDVDGCEKTANVTVPAKPAGTLFTAVRTIINTSCTNCHSATGGNQGGVNLSTDCSIVNTWDRIKVRCVDGTPSFMPQGGQLPAAQKTAITNWVNAGHKFTD